MLESVSGHEKLIVGIVLIAKHRTGLTFSKTQLVFEKNAAHIVTSIYQFQRGFRW